MYDDADPSSIPRWEWVTGVTYPINVRGGPIAGNITSLAFDDATQTLYIGTPDALNVMYANGSLARVDGLVGLPYGNITAVTVQVCGV